jgi:hypothetical protein
LYADEEPGSRAGASPVSAALRSPSGEAKVARGTQADGTPLHGYPTLLAELGTMMKNLTAIPALPEGAPFWVLTTPTPLQQKAMERAGVTLGRQKQSA